MFVNRGGTPSPTVIFTSLVLFELLRWALMNIPQVIMMAVDIRTARAA